jgi:HSP20 family molecular chaperone IbpA
MSLLAMRTTYDFAPLWRSTIGFDRLFDLVDAAQHGGTEDNYPPCNVERLSEDRYQISLAVAGFSPDEIAITAEQSVLTVEGRKAEKHQREFLDASTGNHHHHRCGYRSNYARHTAALCAKAHGTATRNQCPYAAFATEK